ncbi:MAG: SCO family protein [Methylibium sp.]|nr:SCO family protein [Methylibium sp.]
MTSFPEPKAGDDGRRSPSRTARRNALLGAGAGVIAAAGLAGWIAHDRRPPPPAKAAAPGGAGAQRFPDVTLLTHEGKPVRFYSDLLQGRVVLANMMYTQCSNICPPMTANLKRVHQALGERAGRDVHMYSISLLPEFDRPADLKAYVALHRIGPGWTFLTGAKDDIERVRFSLGFYDVDPLVDADRSQHTGMVRIGNEPLDRWCMTPALLEPEQICESIRAIDPAKRPFPGLVGVTAALDDRAGLRPDAATRTQSKTAVPPLQYQGRPTGR